MSDSAIILLDRSANAVSFGDAALRLKEGALTCAALIGKVTSASEHESAVQAQLEIRKVLKAVEDAEEAVKKPLNELRRNVIDQARTFAKELQDELHRVDHLVADYQALEIAKSKAAQAALNTELTSVEKARQLALSGAQTHDERDAINSLFDVQAMQTQEAMPVTQPPRVEGQRVGEDWEVTVSDIWLLARAHPSCVKLEPRISEIKALLNAGVTVAGVKATKTTKASVRLTKEKTIDV